VIGAGPDSRSVAGHLTTAVRLAPRDTLLSAVGGGGEMGGDDEQREPARPAVNPIRKPALPPSLGRLPTELDRLYSELGGPAPLRDDIDRKVFDFCCNEFCWSKVEPEMRRFQADRDIGRRHWPWVAVALSQYRLERNELQKPGATLTPAEVVELLDDIHRSAKKLVNRLRQLQEYSHSLADPAAPLRQPHLAYLDEFISQAAAGYLASEVNQDPQHMARVFFGKQSLMQRLIDIEIAACEAMKRADVGLLKRKRGQADPSLHNFVWQSAKIWGSMTGRKASPHTRDGNESDFVKFVQTLVGLVGAPKPSRKQIEISLKNAAPPMATQKSEQSGA